MVSARGEHDSLGVDRHFTWWLGTPRMSIPGNKNKTAWFLMTQPGSHIVSGVLCPLGKNRHGHTEVGT